MRTLSKLIVGTACATALTLPARAQDKPEAVQDEALEEVVVTAQRRSENLQKVSIAATALNTEELHGKSVQRLADLQSASPALSITDAGQTQSLNIRGIGLASNSPNATAGVATYVDGLFQPPIVQSNSFYDIASVEVLRGPQGTLVGTNSTGGALFINSASPALDRFGGYLHAGVGNFNGREIEGALNLPAGGTFGIRLAGFYRSNDSYYRDVGPFDNESGGLDEKGGRIGMLWKPGSFSALLKLQVNDLENGGFAYRPISGTPFAAYRVGDERTLSFDADTHHRERAESGSLELRQEFASGVVLRSLTGYQRKRMYSFDDLDGSQAPPSARGEITWDYFAGEKQYSEEINVISPTEGRVDWILGGYFQRNEIDVAIYQMEAGFPTDILPTNRRTTTGFFVQTGFELNDALELQVGARYSTYKATGAGEVLIGNGIPGFPPGGLPVASLAGSHEDTRVTGKVALNWNVDPDNFLYFFVARGYKPGGFNSVDSEFDPETVLNYEAGWKSTLLEGRMRTQLALFFNDYSDFQFDVLEPATGQGGILNVANATIKGLEAQVQGRFGRVGLDLGVSYVDSELDGSTFVNTRPLPPGNLGPQCSPGVPSDPPFCFDYTPFIITTAGGSNLYSPEWSANAGIDVEIDIAGGATLTPRINYSYMGSRFTYLAYSPVSDRIGSFSLLSALLTLRKDDWFIEAFGSNLADERYVSGQASASTNEFYGAPRRYGLRAGMEF